MNSVIFPVIISLSWTVITGLIHSNYWRKIAALLGYLLHLIASTWLLWECRNGAIKIINIGNWLPPYGIVLVADLFSCLFLFAISLVFLATVLYSFGERHDHPMPAARLPLTFVLQAGVSLSLLTGDFFNLFVAFEIMLAASYALVTLEIPPKDLKWAFSYLIVSLMSSLGFLCAAAMIYGYTGHLNIAALAQLLKGQEDNPLIMGWSYLLLGIFGLKAGVFPLYFWLPNTYSSLSPSLAALFAGTLTKVGVYVLARVFIILLPGPLYTLNHLMLIIASLTMLLGVLGAISRSTIRGILSYHIISQIGYMVLGIALYTPLALASALWFTIHNIWVKVSLFLIGGMAQRACQSDELKHMGNLSFAMPWLAASFLIQAFSLIGLPPLSGFWGKYLLVLESIQLEKYLLAGVALLTSWLTLFSMLKIWIGAFWQDRDKSLNRENHPWGEMVFSIGLLIAISVFLGIGAEYIYQITALAANQMFEKDTYIQAVLTSSGKGLL